MENDKNTYLQMIQEPINRMSTMSSIYKGFCSTIVAGITGLSLGENSNIFVVVLSFLPVLAFASLDIYYLMLERGFRYLYEQVASGEHECNYKMDPIRIGNVTEMKKAKATVVDCIKSPSFWLFYPLMFAIIIIVIVLKIVGSI